MYGATGAERVKWGTVRDEAAMGGAVMAIGSVYGTVGAGHKPMCARWRSTAAIAAAVTASTICLKEGAESVSESFTVQDIGARCVIHA